MEHHGPKKFTPPPEWHIVKWSVIWFQLSKLFHPSPKGQFWASPPVELAFQYVWQSQKSCEGYCQLKILWKSPGRHFESFGFPKKSPLLPFFNYAYKKMRETGAWSNINKKWTIKEQSFCQKDLEPISWQKIGSLLALLVFCISVSLLVLLCEISYLVFNKFSLNNFNVWKLKIDNAWKWNKLNIWIIHLRWGK